uniref:Hexosyltransferase n=1 Tax=Aegilops tauschii subsp. strangulata TaxID=200361 RepID=A0A453LEG8_AEGTS
MRDQIIMARVYSVLAKSKNKHGLYQELQSRIKESHRAVGEATADAELHRSAPDRMRAMGQVLTKAREELYDCKVISQRLRAMLQSADEQVRSLKKQSTFLSQLAAKTIPNSIHCLSMRLTIDYYLLPVEKRKFPRSENLENPELYHYALFSDNVLAASVVVNSTIMNAKEPEKHVFHLVTDKLNFGAMNMWFLLNPPGKATIHVENVDEFKWLNSSYCPVLRQLESAAMKEFYFKADRPTTLSAGSSNLKYRNPKYLSMLNHLRFYLPEIYPKLDKILFLDDDIVVQKDLTGLWDVDLNGMVNGAVFTCGESFHRFDKYLNFSNPHIARNFDPNACGWAYGMNIFDLKQWKNKDITGIYHKWQTMNEDRVLWKLGTLPPGLMTFYKLTHPLDKSWHVLGLGYNPSIDRSEIDNAAVAHYNGNMKPWLELHVNRLDDACCRITDRVGVGGKIVIVFFRMTPDAQLGSTTETSQADESTTEPKKTRQLGEWLYASSRCRGNDQPVPLLRRPRRRLRAGGCPQPPPEGSIEEGVQEQEQERGVPVGDVHPQGAPPGDQQLQREQ